MEQTGSSSNLNAKTASQKKRITAVPHLSSKNLKELNDTPSASSMSQLPVTTPKDSQVNIREGLASARELPPPAVSSGGNNIKVICRVRPINQKEIDLGNSVCVEFPDKQNISVKVANQGEGEKGPGVQKFAFDRVFDMSSTQEEVFHFGAKAVVESVLEGFNGTIFAYGQTSAGKTHTMQGKIDDPNLKGIIPRMVTAVFQHIEESPEHIEFTVKISIVEIYMEKIRDLISPEKNNLKVREDKGRGIYIEDVTEASVASEAEVYGIMRVGNSNRAICATNMNEGSSRSHLVFIMSIHQKNTHEFTAKTGKLYMIDLAGSEKVGKTGAAGQTLQEAKDINKSLSVLGNVINALTDGKNGHIPYRDSKLTRILQESLGGNSKTTLIIACSPSSFNDQETLSTLRFGYRAKSIKNKAKVNKEMTVAELQVLLDKAEKNLAEKEAKIKQLQAMLVNKANGVEVDLSPSAVIGETKEKSNTENISPTRKLSMDSGDLSEKEEETSPKKDGSPVLNADQEERIKQLEADLQTERHSVRVQTERVNELKNHHARLTEKIIITERENEKLIYKVASMILKVNSLEEAVQEHENQRQAFEALQTKLLAENDELRKAKRALNKQLTEKDEEISRIHRLTSFFNLDKKESAQSVSNEEPVSAAGTATTSSVSSDKARKELAFKINETSKKWISEVTQKVKIAEADLFQELASAYRQKLKKIILTSNFSGGNVGDSGVQELKKKIAQFEDELAQEKKKSEQLNAQYESLNDEYTKVLKDGIPNLEELTQSAITKVLEEERAKFEREKKIMAKELERRVEKTTRVEMDLEKEREKNSKIEETMMEADRISDLKMENLENRLREVTYMLRSLEPEGRRVTVSERKPRDKSERFSNIEKGLVEAQEMVINYKKDLADGKDFDSENIISNNISMDRLNLVKKELQQDLDKEDELRDELAVRQSLTFADPRIVKKIRGGNRKTVGNTQDFLKLLKSPASEHNEERSGTGLSHVATPIRKGSEKPIEEIP